MSSTTVIIPGTETAVRTFKAFPGFTFHQTLTGYAYARTGYAKAGGQGTPRYTWTVRYRGVPQGGGTTLKAAKEIAQIILDDPSLAAR
jgi:hypothetical protein